jgi:hypothetical protein
MRAVQRITRWIIVTAMLNEIFTIQYASPRFAGVGL